MPITPFITPVAVVALATIVAIYFAADKSAYTIALFAAAIFASAVSALALHINTPYWQDDEVRFQNDAAILASRSNARLMSLTYAWGAMVMISAYLLTGLYWYHAWQYASIMTLVGGALSGYAYLIASEDHVLRTPKALNVTAMLAVLQAAGALAGILFLVLSGKLYAHKSDWVANLVFFSGGVAIMMISTISVATHLRIQKD